MSRHLRTLVPVLLSLALAACQSDGPKVDPAKQISLYSESAAMHYANNDLDRAEGQARKALELAPEDLKMRLLVAWCQLRRENRDGLLAAEREFRALLAEGGYEARLGLANTLDRLGRLSQAAAADLEAGRREAVAGKDPAARAAELRAQARTQWGEARTQFAEILKTKPADRSALNGSQRVCAYVGDWKEALGYSLELLRSLEADREFYAQQLDRPQISMADEVRFRQSLDDAKRLTVDTLVFASDALVKLEARDQAVDWLGTAIELAPKRADLYGLRAKRLHDLARYAEAITDIDAFLRLSEHPFEHPDVRGAYELRSKCEAGLRG
jgi:tetratricopeptide (TPR) repeat protein